MPKQFDCSINPRPGRTQSITQDFVAATPWLQNFEVALVDSDQEKIDALRAKAVAGLRQ